MKVASPKNIKTYPAKTPLPKRLAIFRVMWSVSIEDKKIWFHLSNCSPAKLILGSIEIVTYPGAVHLQSTYGFESISHV
jgi:hypothetical protein